MRLASSVPGIEHHGTNHPALLQKTVRFCDLAQRKGAPIPWGEAQPSLRGFTRANLFRMRQFYETYQDDEKVAPLVRQLLRSPHLTIPEWNRT
jgi:hypothetical protein